MSPKEKEIKILKGSLSARKGHCTREGDRVHAELYAKPVNHKNLISAVERLRAKHLSYQQTFEDLEIVLIAEEHESLEDEKNKFKEYDDKINDLFLKANITAETQEMQDLADKQKAMIPTPSPPHPTPQKVHIKLPPEAQVKFNGLHFGLISNR